MHDSHESRSGESATFAAEMARLFDVSDSAGKATRRRSERLSSALDTLRAKHGPAAASMGVQEAIPGGYLGAKIAFGRIPDEADFAETTEDSDTQFATV